MSAVDTLSIPQGTTMAKVQLRSNKEKKKHKQDKHEPVVPLNPWKKLPPK